MPSSLTARSNVTFTSDLRIFPHVTCGDSSSVSFAVTGGPSMVALRASKEKMDRGELKSCENIFTVKCLIGENQRALHGSNVCQLRLKIEIIEEALCGFVVCGRIMGISHGAPGRQSQSGAYDPQNAACQQQSDLLDHLRVGALVKLIHRGASSKGTIIFVNNPDLMKTFYPYVPPEVMKPRAYAPVNPVEDDRPRTRLCHYGCNIGNGRRRGIPPRL